MYQRSTPKTREKRSIPVRVSPASSQQPGLRRGAPERTGRSRPESGTTRPPALEVEGVYIISVAARILDMHPQTLRKYERLGLISPDRTGGMLRLYSREDIQKILLIRHLMDNLGLNLAGVEFALTLVDNLLTMRERLSAAAAGSPAQDHIEQEMARLFRSLNLPVEH